MKKNIVCLIILMISFVLFLSACWDQRLLRDHTLILAISYDRDDDSNKLVKTISFPIPPSQTSGTSESPAEKGSKVISTVGNTVKDAEKMLDKVIPEQFDRSKARVILLGETLARKGIFSTLDSLYRDLRGPLNANTAVFTGKAKNALSSVKSDKTMRVSDVYAELLNSAEHSGVIASHTIQNSRPFIVTEGMDLLLPLLSLDENNEPYIAGTALFDGDKMTGTMSTKETIAFLMLSNQVTKNFAINLKVHDEEIDPNKNFINISIRSNKRKMKIETNNEEIKAKIDVKLNVEIDEYAADHLDQKDIHDTLEKRIEKKLGELSKKMIGKIQQANNDSLEIGKEVRAFHPDTWEQIDWDEEYQNIDIESTFKVDIVHHGIIN